MNNKFFEDRIKPVLNYVGAIGAAILMVAYVIVVVVMIQGFNGAEAPVIELNIVFAVITGLLGFVIMQFLKIQGITFAKNIPENDKIIQDYQALKVEKKKKMHSLTYFWGLSMTKDLLIRCLTLILSSISIAWIVIEGTKDWNLLLLAIVNLLMFICFGLVQLVKAYDFYNEQHINYIKEEIEKLKGEKEQCLKSTEKNS